LSKLRYLCGSDGAVRPAHYLLQRGLPTALVFPASKKTHMKLKTL
jgi:hypothetical protein